MLKNIFAIVLISFIKLYKITLSPFVGNSCRYQPSCSQYGIEAIQKYGAIKGGWITTKRICSCHPWGGHGFDPVP
jgi:uncharacterized protein